MSRISSVPGLTVVPNWSMRAAESRAASVLPGAFSRRLMVDCEASAAPLSGQRPTASFISGSCRKRQLLDTIAPNRREDPELGKVRADRIDDGSLLTDEEMPGAMKRQTALLFGRLGWHEPHVWPGHRLANRFRVGGIVLLPLHIGLHVGRRHQAH